MNQPPQGNAIGSLLSFIVMAFIAMIFFNTCSHYGRSLRYGYVRGPEPSSVAVTSQDTTVTRTEAAEGLDLKAVTALVKRVKNGAELEKELNTPGGINNLDLDQDGKVDYLKVTEYGSGKVKGFSLTVELAPGDVQEVASIELEKKENQVEVATTGSRQVYGPNYGYHSSFGLTDVLLTAWLFNSLRSPYRSPYGYGHYPGSYGGGYASIPPGRYRGRVDPYRRDSSIQTGSTSRKLGSPNAGKTSARIKAPLRNPTQAQKSFQARTGTGSARSGGFGRRSVSSPSRRLGAAGSRTRTSASSRPARVRSGGFGRSSSHSIFSRRMPIPSVRRSSSGFGRSFGK